MNGPDHFREAERLIEDANHVGHTDPQRGDGMLLAAQVHATLALAAATALNDSDGGMPVHDWNAWYAAAGTPTDDEPGQVEPEPADVRVIEVEPGALVTYPKWNRDEPVKVLSVEGTIKSGMVAVRYADPAALDDEETVIAPADMVVTPYGGAE